MPKTLSWGFCFCSEQRRHHWHHGRLARRAAHCSDNILMWEKTKTIPLHLLPSHRSAAVHGNARPMIETYFNLPSSLTRTSKYLTTRSLSHFYFLENQLLKCSASVKQQFGSREASIDFGMQEIHSV